MKTAQTINEHHADQATALARLSPAYRAKLARRAMAYCQQHAQMADSNGFWRGLSARQVIEKA